MSMRHTLLSLSILSSVVILAGAIPVRAQTPVSAPSVVVATGESRIKVAPDQAWVTVSLETRHARGAEARHLGAVAMTSVMAALKNTPLATDAVQTVGFSLHPEYEYVDGRQRMKGFVLSNQVLVRIDDVSLVAEVLDAVGAMTLAESSRLTISGLRFDLKNRATVERQALQNAVEDAMARARSMAAGAGLSVGRTLRIEQAGSAGVPVRAGTERFMMASEAAVATPVSPSDIEISAQVTLTVEIK